MNKVGTHALASAIGGIVRRERLKRRWTAERLAHECGHSDEIISKIERGLQGAKISVLFNILWALDCSEEIFLEIVRADATLRQTTGSMESAA